MSRCNTIIAAALAAAALAAPTALAQLPDIHAGLSAPAPEGQSKQDLRMPDTRDAARAATPSDRNDARPETAGNAKVSADAANSAPAKDYSKNAATGDKVRHARHRRGRRSPPSPAPHPARSRRPSHDVAQRPRPHPSSPLPRQPTRDELP